jgi:hypothetical protein
MSSGSSVNVSAVASRLTVTNNAYEILEGKPVLKCPLRGPGKI